MRTAEQLPSADVCAAVGRGLAVHPDDGLVLLRAVRDDGARVVEFWHEWVNPAAERNAGRPLQGLGLLEAYGPDATLFPLLCGLLGTGGWHRMQQTFDTDAHDRLLHSRTFDIFLSDAGDDRITCQYRDVTELHRARATLQHQAGHDDLTGAANRRHLREHLDLALGRLDGRRDRSVLLMLADLDRFKAVNDVHGHPLGDRLLRLAAERMRAAMRPSDLVARYGGDEFVVVCQDVTDEAEAAGLADRLRSAVAGLYELDGETTVEVGLSIGSALTDHPVPGEELLTRADRALYAEKAARTRSA